MAASEYYNSNPTKPQRRSDAPLPPVPDYELSHRLHDNHPSSSPFTTPFDDPTYRPYGQQSQQSLGSEHPYYGAGGGPRVDDPSPYSEDIPLRNHPSKQHQDPLAYDQNRHDEAAYDTRTRPSHNRRKKKKGLFSGRVPWVVYFFTLVQIAVFIAEIARNAVLTHSPIEIHPQFNPMIGPSPYVLINMGARFVPCMQNIPQVHDTQIHWPSPSTTSADTSTYNGNLADLCGFGGFQISGPNDYPNQWYRFIIPMFLHAGIIHIGFNMLLQMTLGRDMEREIGSLRFLLVYLSSGVFGFVLGGNFAPKGIASTGASGSLFGIIALMLLDLLYHWGERKSPWVDLAWIIFEIAISFVLGLLPGLDNFSHIGGFLMGLVLGICILHSPDVLRRRVGADYDTVATAGKRFKTEDAGIRGFIKEPLGFFRGRKPLWWAWWLVRAAALIGVLIAFIVLLTNFYKRCPSECHWCRHLSCMVSHLAMSVAICQVLKNLQKEEWCNWGKLPDSTNEDICKA
ncbi:MAG: hypothetical protein L6R39_001563 [Caloplaca ligustica]|nr:MAG: hypothetical protein L6R39_001563 [Caloplaca ligustica]